MKNIKSIVTKAGACALAATVLLGSGALLKTAIVSAQAATDRQVVTDTAVSASSNPAKVLSASAESGSSPASSTIPNYNLSIAMGKTYGESDYQSQPTAKDLSMNQAAQIAAQDFTNIFGRDVIGSTVDMYFDAYSLNTDATILNTPAWDACFTLTNGMHFTVVLDSVTGQIYSASGDTDLTFAQQKEIEDSFKGLTQAQADAKKEALGKTGMEDAENLKKTVANDPVFEQTARDFVANKLQIGQIASVRAQDSDVKYSTSEVVTLSDGQAYVVQMDADHAVIRFNFYPGGVSDTGAINGF